ncbi:protein PAXX-like [Tubulanus polymorphus]|uniref:protein PAXX-like n=1 Tax=Tubulanus polymorphus TaxID=672921 RepID=UPI003DA500C9
MALKESLKEAKVDDLKYVISEPGSKYLVYSKSDSNQWILGVSDGVDVWRTELDSVEIDAYMDMAHINTKEAYFDQFRLCFTNDKVAILQVGAKIVLTVGVGSSAFTFDLFEMKAADKKNELKDLLFHYVKKSKDLEKNMANLNQRIDCLQQAVAAAKNSGASGMIDLDNRKGSPVKPKPKKVGMSVVNPNSRKRKAAGGVAFD